MSSGDSYKSYSKALFLLVALAVVLFIGTGVLKIVLSPAKPIRALFGAEALSGVPYRDEQKDSVKKQLAGFWQSEGNVESGLPFVHAAEKMELRPNGIFWKVKVACIRLPSGDSTRYVEATTGYLSPYYHTGSSPDSISCQVHFIGKAVAASSETCYVAMARPDASLSLLPQLQTKPGSGEGAVDTMWDLMSDGTHLRLGGNPYSAYDTSGRALYSFFPKGSTEIINKISLAECGGESSMERIIKRALTADVGKLSVASRTRENVLDVVDEYYKIPFAENLAQRVTVFKKGRAEILFCVVGSGKVVGPIRVKSDPWNMKLDKELKQEVQTWVFPSCPAQGEPVKVAFTVAY
jgi:hypothetical protein